MSVAVVVPCRNEAAHIALLLGALAAQSRPPEEIVIVDDRSTDGTRSRVRHWQETHARTCVRVIQGPGRGPGPAMNAGIRSARADVIMRMDGHAVPAPDYLERCLAVLNDPSVGVVGGVWQVQPGASTAIAKAIAAVVSHPVGSGGAMYRSLQAMSGGLREVETVPFGTFPRAVWRALGGFDEALEANEDFDFNYRARKAGYRVVLDPAITCRYSARGTLRALGRQYFRYGYWKARMLAKDPRALQLRQVPPIAVGPMFLAAAALAVVFPSVGTATTALAYPVATLLAGTWVSVQRGVSTLAAAAAVATVHLTWSYGFATGLLGLVKAKIRLS